MQSLKISLLFLFIMGNMVPIVTTASEKNATLSIRTTGNISTERKELIVSLYKNPRSLRNTFSMEKFSIFRKSKLLSTKRMFTAKDGTLVCIKDAGILVVYSMPISNVSPIEKYFIYDKSPHYPSYFGIVDKTSEFNGEESRKYDLKKLKKYQEMSAILDS